MAVYEYVCLACEHPFEQRRAMGAVDTAIACPSCDSDRVRRRFSLFAAGGAGAEGQRSVGGGGCACGGACACGH